jgi:hypothetical protein
MMIRWFTIGALALVSVAAAAAGSAADRDFKLGESRSLTREQSDREASEAERRNTARERAWDQKMKQVGRSICSGC